MKKKLLFAVILSFTISGLIRTVILAKDEDRLALLTKQAIEAKDNKEVYAALEELKGTYFSCNKYNEFIDFLNSLLLQKKSLEPAINYYIALTRYKQLGFLEETQDWNEYFSSQDTYRQQLVASALKTIDSVKPSDIFSIYAHLLLWEFHKEQQDALIDKSLDSLVSSVQNYASQATDINTIKDVADRLIARDEKLRARQLYKLYVDKVANSQIKNEELEHIAGGFYQEGNLELAESLYDAYLDKLLKTMSKEKAAPILIGLANQFAIKDKPDAKQDAMYAEKIFKRLEELGVKEINDENLLYTRAYSLEKAKEYSRAKDMYLLLIQRFPQSGHFDEAAFKIGIIYTYIERDIKTGRSYFDKLAQKEAISPQVISSIYQLGLLSQWEEDLKKAREYYDLLLGKAKDSYLETVNLTKERIKEIEASAPIEYNLKTFLDVSLKPEQVDLDLSQAALKTTLYRPKKEEVVGISSLAVAPESGCMQVEISYLWSGHIGQAKPAIQESAFDTDYKHTGTKEVNLVIVSPNGVQERSIDMLDVQNP